jgi:hypothetical protein
MESLMKESSILDIWLFKWRYGSEVHKDVDVKANHIVGCSLGLEMLFHSGRQEACGSGAMI